MKKRSTTLLLKTVENLSKMIFVITQTEWVPNCRNYFNYYQVFLHTFQHIEKNSFVNLMKIEKENYE